MNERKIKEKSDELLVRLVEQVGIATTMCDTPLVACLLALETAASILRREARDSGAKIEHVKEVQRIASMAGEIAYEASGMGSRVRQRVREANTSKISEADAWEQAGAQVVDLMARINKRTPS